MIRYYCDGCGAALAPEDHQRLRRDGHINGTRIDVEVTTAVNGTWNGGNVCHRCVAKVVAGADEPSDMRVRQVALEVAVEDKDAAYAERDRLVAALSKCFPSHLATHDGADWHHDWRTIVCIHLPTGQATWHIHDSERPWFSHLLTLEDHWDGHSTAEKYERLGRMEPLYTRMREST
jgi:hypothetical protein